MKMTSALPIYMNYAASVSDPVERLKCVMVANISYVYCDKIFEKPLNPMIGETYQMFAEDGARVYVEQTETDPPRQHFMIDGPDNRYSVHGHMRHKVESWGVTATATPEGYKVFKFHDG